LQSEQILSRPTADHLAAWRIFIETAWALLDILDAELQAERGLTLRWYDVLVHLEATTDGLPMNELAARILSSKSGLTRVVDRMDEAGLVRRERPAHDRRVVNVFLTGKGLEELHAARDVHHRSIHDHFARHLDDHERSALADALENVRHHVRPLRPGRVSDVQRANSSPRKRLQR
jgi:DNA-binding MarR family transcriptional regulator